VSVHSAFRCPHHPTVPGIRSFVAFIRPRRSLILGVCLIPALAPPAFVHPWPSPVLGLRSFSVFAHLAFAHPRCLHVLGVHSFSALPALARPAFACPPYSPVLGVQSFSALAYFQYLLDCRSLASDTCLSSAFTRTWHSQHSLVQRSLACSICQFLACTRSRRSPASALAHPVLVRFRPSSVFGVRSFSVLNCFWRSLVRHSLAPGVLLFPVPARYIGTAFEKRYD
jgi:hypothetical protein